MVMTVMSVATPMVKPSMVREARSLWARMAPRVWAKLSAMASTRVRPFPLLITLPDPASGVRLTQTASGFNQEYEGTKARVTPHKDRHGAGRALKSCVNANRFKSKQLCRGRVQLLNAGRLARTPDKASPFLGRRRAYSVRKARAGSIEEARRAGIKPASVAAVIRTRTEPKRTVASRPFIS